MIRKLFDKLFGKKNTTAVVIEQVAVNQESVKKLCGCGRSPTGYCIGLHNLSEDDWQAVKEMNKAEVLITSVAQSAPAKNTKKPVAKMTAKKTESKKPATKLAEHAAWPFETAPVKSSIAKKPKKAKIVDALVEPTTASTVETKKQPKKSRTKTKNV
jgi:CDGSH-type Zn-finger protein